MSLAGKFALNAFYAISYEYENALISYEMSMKLTTNPYEKR